MEIFKQYVQYKLFDLNGKITSSLGVILASVTTDWQGMWNAFAIGLTGAAGGLLGKELILAAVRWFKSKYNAYKNQGDTPTT